MRCCHLVTSPRAEHPAQSTLVYLPAPPARRMLEAWCFPKWQWHGACPHVPSCPLHGASSLQGHVAALLSLNKWMRSLWCQEPFTHEPTATAKGSSSITSSEVIASSTLRDLWVAISAPMPAARRGLHTGAFCY